MSIYPNTTGWPTQGNNNGTFGSIITVLLSWEAMSLKSESEVSVGQEDTARTVVISLLAAAVQSDHQVRAAAASSLARIGGERPYLVLSEWHTVLGRERRRAVRETPNTRRP